MASAVSPGGGAIFHRMMKNSGCLAPTFSNFVRKSCAFLSHPKCLYPIGSDQCLYSPEILVIKDSTYARMKSKDLFQVSMLTLPAVRKPRRRGDNYMYEVDREAMRVRIEAIFKIGILEKAQVLILGAFGCGAFSNKVRKSTYGNPQAEVMAMFQHYVTKYRAYFEHIVFAVLAVGPNGTENYEKFSQFFN